MIFTTKEARTSFINANIQTRTPLKYKLSKAVETTIKKGRDSYTDAQLLQALSRRSSTPITMAVSSINR